MANDSGFGAALTSLMSAAFSKRTKAKTEIFTSQVKTYILDNANAWFEDAARIPATRSWIERQIDQDYDIYMIIGFHTITNASVSQESLRQETTKGHITLPASKVLAATGVAVPFGDLIDPSVDVHYQSDDGTGSKFLVPGEQVCALQHLKLRHRWLSSKNLDKSRLSRVPHWSSLEAYRGEE